MQAKERGEFQSGVFSTPIDWLTSVRTPFLEEDLAELAALQQRLSAELARIKFMVEEMWEFANPETNAISAVTRSAIRDVAAAHEKALVEVTRLREVLSERRKSHFPTGVPKGVVAGEITARTYVRSEASRARMSEGHRLRARFGPKWRDIVSDPTKAITADHGMRRLTILAAVDTDRDDAREAPTDAAPIARAA
jgi:hypothetical protein